jgi:methionyl aminopeptidase
MKIMDICNEIEASNERLIEANGLLAGKAFPTGASLNHVAAHWTPNIGDETVLQYDDIMKIDYGTHIRGIMTDCAFSVSFNPEYDELLKAVKAATETGIKAAGIDARLGEIGAEIQETMESYEVTIKGKTYPVKPCRNLSGHSMEPYIIHAGKSVHIVKTANTPKMEEGEQYAVETFGSTGEGYVRGEGECSHYMRVPDAPKVPLRNPNARKLFSIICKEFGTLAFARKWLEPHFPNHGAYLNQLVQAGLVRDYPPLVDKPGSMTA